MTRNRIALPAPNRFTLQDPAAVLEACDNIADKRSRSGQLYIPLGRHVQSLRLQRGLTQHRLANDSGVGKTVIYELEARFRRKRVFIMKTVAETQRVDLGTIIVSPQLVRQFARVVGPSARGSDWVLAIEFEWLVGLVYEVVTDVDAAGNVNPLGSIVDGMVLSGVDPVDERAVARIAEALAHLAGG